MAIGFTSISVNGFKSLAEEHTIEIRPLTILAGTNSSGKSSILQPLLMMKQTLHESYDPGDLKINGPNVKFTRSDQFLSKYSNKLLDSTFRIKIVLDKGKSLTEKFALQKNNRIKIVESLYEKGLDKIILHPNMSKKEILSSNPAIKKDCDELSEKLHLKEDEFELKVERNRCLLNLMLYASKKDRDKKGAFKFSVSMLENDDILFKDLIAQIIHVPALRGNPKRDYDISALGPIFPGTFENYVASIIYEWRFNNDNRLNKLEEFLKMLNLTQNVVAKQIDDTRVEIRVCRLPVGKYADPNDLVSIADVGYGVSQTLPVLVALLTAKPGQLVFIEQPEIHLHPRGQVKMANILAYAANKGVRVVVETHSSLLLRGIQTIAAKGEIISPKKVILHWFERNPDNGITRITSAGLNEAGSFGDWPEDFGDTIMDAESDYIEAAETHLMRE